MAIKPALTKLTISTADARFYRGFSQIVTTSSKILIGGLVVWACYVIAGLALGFFSYRRGLPLTMRSSLTSLFGEKLSGSIGNLVPKTFDRWLLAL